jgi:hypothetical protein
VSGGGKRQEWSGRRPQKEQSFESRTMIILSTEGVKAFSFEEFFGRKLQLLDLIF